MRTNQANVVECICSNTGQTRLRGLEIMVMMMMMMLMMAVVVPAVVRMVMMPMWYEVCADENFDGYDE